MSTPPIDLNRFKRSTSIPPVTTVPSARTSSTNSLVSLKPITPPSRRSINMVSSNDSSEVRVQNPKTSQNTASRVSIKPTSSSTVSSKGITFQSSTPPTTAQTITVKPPETSNVVPSPSRSSPSSRSSSSSRTSLSPRSSLSSRDGSYSRDSSSPRESSFTTNSLSSTGSSPYRSTSSINVTPPVAMPSGRNNVSRDSSYNVSRESPYSDWRKNSTVTRSQRMEETVADKLEDKGYTVTDVVMLEYDGQKYAKYLKVLTKLGQTAFIELDQNGKVTYDDRSRVMIEDDSVDIIPNSKVISTFECASQAGGCGVAYDCNNSFCVMTRPLDSPDTPATVNLRTVSSSGDSQVSMSGTPTPYPVVLLSEVMKNPLKSFASIEEATRRIRNVIMNECRSNYNVLGSAVEDMKRILQENREWTEKYLNGLARDTVQLQGFRASYVANSPLPPSEAEKADQVVELLRERDEQIKEAFKLCETIPECTEQIRDITNKLEAITRMVKANNDLVGKTDATRSETPRFDTTVAGMSRSYQS